MLYIIFRSIWNVFGISAKTVLPEQHLVVESIEAKGVLIKDETVYYTDVPIEETEKKNEGEKIPVGYQIANINLLEDSGIKKLELEKIEQAIMLKTQTAEEIEYIRANNKKIKKEQYAIAESIQDNIEEFGRVKELKKGLKANNYKIVDLDSKNEFLEYDLDSLHSLKLEKEEEIKNNTIVYKSDRTGIISYELDGYEEKFKLGDFGNYKIEDFQEDETIEAKDGYKVIENFYWYISLLIDEPEEVKDYKVDDLMTVVIGEQEDSLTGKIMAINNYDGKKAILLRLNSHLEDNYMERFVDLEIIKSRSDGFKIPNKCITEKEGQQGVYIKEFNGIVRYRPVIIMSSDDDYSYIVKGNAGYDTYLVLKEGDDPVKTVTMYDEILLNPKRVSEGEIID